MFVSYVDRERAPGPKRLLALDGGGMRGALTLEVLSELEAMLRGEVAAGGDGFVLADWFDYIAGTSTGAIIAAALAWGMPVRDIKELYRTLGREMFSKPILPRRFWYRYRPDSLTAKLKDVFGEATLGDPRLRSLLMMVLRNETTDSPWPLSNATCAVFNERSRPDCNLDLPLWQLVRGSTAAPTYFPAEVIDIGGRRLIFADGSLTGFNNPAFQLFLMATLDAYGLCWPTGTDRLLLVSVGTGYHPNAHQNLQLSKMHILHNLLSVPSALLFSALVQQDVLCRVFGRCLVGGEIDSELGDLHSESSHAGRELFTYLRYNANLSAEGLVALGLGGLDPTRLRRLDSYESVSELEAVGRAVAARDLRVEHYASFL